MHGRQYLSHQDMHVKHMYTMYSDTKLVREGLQLGDVFIIGIESVGSALTEMHVFVLT